MSNEMPEALQAARLRVSKDRPYLNAVLWSLTPVPKPGMGTFAVDKYYRWYYDPDITNWTMPQMAGALQHEVYHLLRDHHARAELINADNMGWNIAGDLEINDDLALENVTLPDGCLQPKMFKLPDGETAEFYYQRIPKQPVNGGNGYPQTGDGQASPGKGKCGSASGIAGQWEDAAPGQRNGDGSMSAPGVREHEADLIKRQVAQDIQASASRGDVPEWLKRWAKETMNPTVNWRKELEARVRRARADAMGMVDYTYRKLSRRASLDRRIIYPAMRRPIVNAAVVIDTSGSIGDKELSKAMGEIKGILKACGMADVNAIVCDADVKSAKRVFRPEDIVLSGGGGTDMRIGINHALADKPRPDIIIVLTDGYTPWPEAPIAARLIACIIGGSMQGVPEWARAIEVKD